MTEGPTGRNPASILGVILGMGQPTVRVAQMLFANNAKRYPSLAQYLERRPRVQIDPAAIAPAVIGTIFMIVGIPLMIVFAIAGLALHAPVLLLLMAMGAWAFAAGRGALKKKVRDPLAEDAREISEYLSKIMNLRAQALPTLTILDECARQWARVHSCMGAQSWKREDLPSHYKTVREHALQAADRAMLEALVLSGPTLPTGMDKRDWRDFVDDVVSEFVKPGSGASYAPAPAGPAREIAERMRTLADEVESVNAQLLKDPNLPQQQTSVTALDALISEVRVIRQAEEELHQNVQA